jgi:hypothetical protein
MSINKITYFHDIFPNFTGIYVLSNPKINIFHFFDSIEVSEFLNSLETDKNYIVSPELINLANKYNPENPLFTLSDPFIISKDSDPYLIADLILKQVCLACDIFNLEDSQINIPKILLKYKEINLDSF